jgi:hypothetical protein
LEAKNLAEAALHYARVTKAANDTHADCLRIITRAEMRMADEVDRVPSAQGRRTDLDFPRGSGEVPTLNDLGISSQRISEWRETREADDWDGPSFQAAADAATVCRKFETSRRHEVLSFNHHREVVSLPPDEADALLEWAGR